MFSAPIRCTFDVSVYELLNQCFQQLEALCQGANSTDSGKNETTSLQKRDKIVIYSQKNGRQK
jgi:hypothetical protein